MVSHLRNSLHAALCGVMLLTLVGCCGPTRHAVNVTLDQQAFGGSKPAVEVVITALNDQEAAYLSEYPMSRFFSTGDTERGGLDKVVMQFGPSQPVTQSFSPANKGDWEQHWGRWERKEAKKLFVMAFLPGRFEDKPGSLDARRQIVPLDKCKWPKGADQAIEFRLTPAKLVLETPYKQGK